uniref:DUF4440 domain-containing protein n=1 Tax=Plectus sambesii TaxID=2011161 RepID=A0A914VIA0_9BILA
MSGLEQEIKSRHAELTKQLNAGNAEGAAALFNQDCTMILAGGNQIKGRAGIEALYKQVMAGGASTTQGVTEEVNGSGDWAFERGTYQTHAESGTTSGGYLLVWKKIDGNWLIHNDCFTVNNPSA